jgi:polysaccharide deacetylase family protein (PEP-CTERM system associated)
MPSGVSAHSPVLRSVFTIDVEEWFHILELRSSPAPDTWHRLESRVERNIERLLELTAQQRVCATFFFVGWIARRYPHLVRAVASQGHEIGSHSDLHEMAHELGRVGFARDAASTRLLLEDIAGTPVIGYRAPGFSLTIATPWMFEELARAGYLYDASAFPAPRRHGGLIASPRCPYGVVTRYGLVFEFPATVVEVCGQVLSFFGGGYLRLFPYPLVRAMAYRVVQEGRLLVWYIHPREIDPTHPRLRMSLRRRFKTYVNLDTTAHKIERLLSEFGSTSFAKYLATTESEVQLMTRTVAVQCTSGVMHFQCVGPCPRP